MTQRILVALIQLCIQALVYIQARAISVALVTGFACANRCPRFRVEFAEGVAWTVVGVAGIENWSIIYIYLYGNVRN